MDSIHFYSYFLMFHSISDQGLLLFSEDLFDSEDCTPNGSKCDLVQIFQILPTISTATSISTLLPSSNYYNQTIPSHNPLVKGNKNDKTISSLSSNNRPNLNHIGSISINHNRHGNCKKIINEQ